MSKMETQTNESQTNQTNQTNKTIRKLNKIKVLRDQSGSLPRRSFSRKKTSVRPSPVDEEFSKSKIMEFLHESKTYLHEVLPDQHDQYVSYIAPFRKEFLSSFTKRDRKSNKTHTHTMIKDHLDQLLFSGEAKDIESYIKKHVSVQSFPKVKSFLRVHSEILKEKEYLYSLPIESDISNSQLIQAYQTLELNPSQQMAPSWVRTFYKTKCEKIMNSKENSVDPSKDIADIAEVRKNTLEKVATAYYRIICVYMKQLLPDAS